MPYRWTETEDAAVLTLWPHRSMTPGGFVLFIGATAALFTLPLMAVLGTPVLWWLLVPVAGAVAAIWFALVRSGRGGTLSEELRLDAERARLRRREPSGRELTWEANAYWVSVHLHAGDRPVPNYLTLKGAGREVELGAFLGPEEREALHGQIGARLAGLRRP